MLLLTGQAGFIGSHVARGLTDAGVGWCGVDRCCDGPGGGDVRDVDALVHDAPITTIVHLASPTGVAELNGRSAVHTEILEGAEAVAQLAERTRARVLFFSSSEVYGQVDGVIDATTPLAPRSSYARGKAEAEEMLRRRVDDLVILRPFNVYGVGQRRGFLVPNVIDALTTDRPVRLVGGGTPIRQPTYVGDIVEAVLRTCNRWPADVRMYNVAGPEALTTRDVVAQAAEALGVTPLIEAVDPERLGRASSTEITSRRVNPDLIDGWTPPTTFEVGLTHLLRAARPSAARNGSSGQ